MNIDENLVDGWAHFGALQLAGIPVDEEPEETKEGDSEEVQVLGSWLGYEGLEKTSNRDG